MARRPPPRSNAPAYRNPPDWLGQPWRRDSAWSPLFRLLYGERMPYQLPTHDDIPVWRSRYFGVTPVPLPPHHPYSTTRQRRPGWPPMDDDPHRRDPTERYWYFEREPPMRPGGRGPV